MSKPTIRRIAPAALVALALPVLMGAGKCGIALDFTETFLITDPVDRIVLVVDDGNIDAVAYERNTVLLKRHTFAFERGIGDPETSVEDGVLFFERHCLKSDVCTFDHLLEVPLGVAFDITMEDASIDLGYIDGDIAATFGTGRFEGVRLAAPQLDITADAADVIVDFAAVPETVTIDVGVGQVFLEVPAGEYRCALVAEDGDVALADVGCNDAATAALDVRVGRGDIDVRGIAP